MSNQALPIAEMAVSPFPPALAMAAFRAPTRPVQPVQAVQAVQPLQPRRPCVLVITEDRAWAAEVRSLVEAESVDVEFRHSADLASQPLAALAQGAEIVVVVGALPRGEDLADLGGLADKPVVWLPAPQGYASRLDSTRNWRRNAGIALQAALSPRGNSEEEVELDLTGTEAPTLDSNTGELHQGDLTVRVTPTECNLLKVLLASRGHWIPASELRLRAFGPGHACHDSLIRVHVYKLRRKLTCLSAQIRSAKGRGYMLA